MICVYMNIYIYIYIYIHIIGYSNVYYHIVNILFNWCDQWLSVRLESNKIRIPVAEIPDFDRISRFIKGGCSGNRV